MAKLRFVGREPHRVPLLGRTVQPDELVEVDNDVFKQHDWPETTWTVVDRKATTKDKG